VPAIVGSSISRSAGGGPNRKDARIARPMMSEKQVQAYLAARDAVRRVKRASAFFPPSASFDSAQTSASRPHSR